MFRNIYSLTLPVLILIIAGCSGSAGGGGSASDTGAAETGLPETEKETAIVQDRGNGIIAGLNLNENISEEESISVGGEISWIPGLDGKALLLDSDGEFISLPDSDDLDLPGNGSVSVWIHPAEHIDFAGILHKGIKKDFSDEAWSLQYWTGHKPAIILHNAGGTKKQITADSSLELNRWHHIAACWGYEDTEGKYLLRFYVDGEKKGEKDIASFLPLMNSSGDLIIGSQLPESHSSKYGHITFRGAIDNIIIYNRFLTDAEVKELFNEYSGS